MFKGSSEIERRAGRRRPFVAVIESSVGWAALWRALKAFAALRFVAALGLVCAACSGTTEDPTALVLAISAEAIPPGEIDNFEVQVDRAGSTKTLALFSLIPGGGDLGTLPGTMTLQNGSGHDPADPVTISVRAKLGNKLRVERRAIVQYISHKTKVLRMPLRYSCVDFPEKCSDDETCSGGECVKAKVDPTTLPDYSEQLMARWLDTEAPGSSSEGCFDASPDACFAAPLDADIATLMDSEDCAIDAPAAPAAGVGGAGNGSGSLGEGGASSAEGALNLEVEWSSTDPLRWVVLDRDPQEGWDYESGSRERVHLAPGLCKALKAQRISAIRYSAACTTKAPEQAVCKASETLITGPIGGGGGAALSLTPRSKDWGSVVVGDSVDTSFDVANVGGDRTGVPHVTIAGDGASQFVVTDNGCGDALAAGEHCTIGVRFTASLGEQLATLRVDASPGGTISAALSGTGVAANPSAAALQIRPSGTQDFGDVLVGRSSDPLALTIENTGNEASGELAVDLGDSSTFVATRDRCSGKTLDPAESCTVEVVFSPADTGVDRATLVVSADPGGDSSVKLTGAGLAPAALVLSPTRATFPDTGVGDDAVLHFTLENTGDVAAGSDEALSLTLEGDDPADFAIASDDCGKTLESGDRCTIDVRFEPRHAGSSSAVLRVSAAPGGTVDSALQGQAAASLALVAGELGGDGSIDGVGVAARFHGIQAITADADGNLYLSEPYDLRKITLSTAEVTTLAGSAMDSGYVDAKGNLARFSNMGGLAAGDGVLYIADTDNNLIRTLNLETLAVSTLAGSGAIGYHDDRGEAATFAQPSGLAFDGDHTLYVADTGNSVIRQIDTSSGAVNTLTGIPTPGFANGAPTVAQFNNPRGLVFDPSGHLYVADANNNVIRDVTVATGSVITLVGSPGSLGNTNGSFAEALFYYPETLARDRDGNLYVGDLDAIRKIDLVHSQVSSFGGYISSNAIAVSGSQLYGVESYGAVLEAMRLSDGTSSPVAGAARTYEAMDGSGADAHFITPQKMVSDGQGALYVVDAGNDGGQAVRKLDLANGTLTTLSLGDIPRVGQIYVSDMTTARDGTLYALDRGGVIASIQPDTLNVSAFVGNPNGGDCVSGVDGMGTAATLCSPEMLTSDQNGHLYVLEASGQVRTVDIASAQVGTITVPMDEFIVNEYLDVRGLASDGGNFLYISGNEHVARLDLTSRTLTRIAGTPGQAGFADGDAATSRLRSASGLDLDDEGNLFIADSGNHAVRKVVLATGEVSTVLGSPEHQGVKLDAIPAYLNSPANVLVLSPGELAVSDEGAVLLLRY